VTNHIRVAIVGVGNCAKSLVEGIAFYSIQSEESGLAHDVIGRWRVSDLQIVTAFDIDRRKVGKKLHEAVSADPNRTLTLTPATVSEVRVRRGPTLDSIIPQLKEHFILESDIEPVDIELVLKQAKVDVVVNYLPTGSDQAAATYVEASLAAGCSFVNCMPATIARSPKWQRRFKAKGCALIGDDVKSQCGATIVNKALLELLALRGVEVTRSSQTNYGGNADHFNLRYRCESKEQTKQTALRSTSKRNKCTPTAKMIYVEDQYDHKRAEIQIDGRGFGHAPVSIRIVVEDEDSPNSSGVVVDAIRVAYALSQSGKSHWSNKVSPFLMKAPPKQLNEAEAYRAFSKIIHSLGG